MSRLKFEKRKPGAAQEVVDFSSYNPNISCEGVTYPTGTQSL